MYEAKITQVGNAVADLLGENMLVLFGPTAPQELRDICAVHDGAPTSEQVVRTGGELSIGRTAYRITHCGDAANTNMGGLGHLTVVFGGEGELLPGSIRVEPATLPKLEAGTVIRFQ